MYTLLTSNYKIDLISINDIAFYGLTLNIININNLYFETLRNQKTKWVVKSNYNSILLIILLAFSYTLSFVNEAKVDLFSSFSLNFMIVAITFSSLIYSISINRVIMLKRKL
jgi:hypothetical protein